MLLKLSLNSRLVEAAVKFEVFGAAEFEAFEAARAIRAGPQ